MSYSVRHATTRRPGSLFLLIGVMAIVLLAGSAFAAKKETTYFSFNLDELKSMWDLPWPSDLQVRPDGTINLDGAPTKRQTYKMLKQAVESGYGFSTMPVIYFHFNHGLHPMTIPNAEITVQPGAPILMMDIDPKSPEQGRRFPLRVRVYDKKPAFNYGPKNLLAVMPVPGYILRENTQYAVVIMDSLRDINRQRLQSPAAFEELKHGRAPSGVLGQRALELYGPMFRYLNDRGVKIEHVVAATVFTTGDPTRELRQVFDWAAAHEPLSLSEPLQVTREYDKYYVLEGAVMMPQLQDGMPPFHEAQGGRIHFDGSGKPLVQREERVPVCVTIPKSKMPAAGFPLMLYIHGTAGVSTQFVDRGEVTEDSPYEKATSLTSALFREQVPAVGQGPALIYAQRGIAGVGAAVPQNGQRGGDPSMIPFYNFFSIEALRDNVIQAAAEQALLLRIMEHINIDASLCPKADTSSTPSGKIFFDRSHLFGMGQSLGSLILGPYGAVETDFIALIPSGEGINWGLMMAQGNPAGLDPLRVSGKGTGELVKLDMFHPFVSLIQTAMGPADPGSFVRHVIEDPFPGHKPKHVWMSCGQFDEYFSPTSQAGIVFGMGLDLVGNVNEATILEPMGLAGKQVKEYPVSGNITTKDGSKVTGVAVQYEQVGPLDGHHINFQRQETKYQYGCFLYSLLKDGTPTLYAPQEPWEKPCGE